MNNDVSKKGSDDGYKALSPEGKKIVEMYLTARQFKNAILEEEMIIIPAIENREGVINWGGTKMTCRGTKVINRVFPFVVTKAFACEVYLKLLLSEENFDFNILRVRERHDLSKLFQNMNESFKNRLYQKFLSEFGEQASKEFVDDKINEIADVFVKWRYIYEEIDEETGVIQENKLHYGFLSVFCEYLDRASQQKILEKYNYDVDKNMR